VEVQKLSSYLQNQLSSEKFLGMYWNTKQGVFQFETKFHRIPKEVIYGDRVPTKRELLGIAAKILVQNKWSNGKNWDEAIPTELHQNWNFWLSELCHMHHFKIPRVCLPT